MGDTAGPMLTPAATAVGGMSLAGEEAYEFLSSPPQKKLLNHQSSMMENVRHRLETTPQIDVAGILQPSKTMSAQSGGATSASPPTAKTSQLSPQPPSSYLKHRRLTHTCCGKEVKISFLSLLLITITSVMVLTMIAQLLTQVFTSFNISDNLINICQNSTGALLQELEISLFSGLNRYGVALSQTMKDDLEQVFFAQAQSQLGSFVNFVMAAGINPMLQTSNSLRFIQSQVLASFGDSIDLAAFGGSFNSATTGEDVFYSATECGSTITGNVSCRPTTAQLLANGTLETCGLGDARIACTVAPFNLSNEVPYMDQRALQDLSVFTPQMIWSDVYVVPDGFQVTPRAGGMQQNSTAISLSFPIFPLGCNSYQCMEGVAWTTITSRALGVYCLSIISTLQQSSNIESGPNPFTNNTVLYMVNNTGAMIAGAWSEREAKTDLIIPSQVIYSRQATAQQLQTPSSVAKQIRDSTAYLESYMEGGFSNTALDNFTALYYVAGTSQVCPNLRWANCSLVIVTSAVPPSSLPTFTTREPSTRIVLVLTMSVENLVAFFKASDQQIADTVQQQQNAQDLVLDSIGIGAAIAAVAVLCGVLLSMILAIKITQPLGKIEKEMSHLVEFKFNENGDDDNNGNLAKADKYYSRVVEVNKAEKMLEKLEDSIEVFSKFVPSTVVKGIVQSKPQASQLHVSPCDVTVAFSDIKGFTTISEKLETLDLLFLLSRYLTVMTEVVELYEGTVTEILGDGLLVIWNAPDRCVLHCAKAAACALAMQVAVAALCIEFQPILQPLGLEDFSIRVGIHSGRVLAGNIGSKTKLKYGCIGDAVNTASRLEGLCKLYQVGIICSADTFAQFPPNKFQTRKLDLVQVKGKDKALGLYEVQSLNETVGVEYYDPVTHERASTTCEDSPVLKPAHGIFHHIPLLSSLHMIKEFAQQPQQQQASPPPQQARKKKLSFGPIASLQQLVIPQIEVNCIYEEALEAFQHADFPRARELLLQIEHCDVPSQLLLSRVQAAELENIDATTWTGANRLTEKF